MFLSLREFQRLNWKEQILHLKRVVSKGQQYAGAGQLTWSKPIGKALEHQYNCQTIGVAVGKLTELEREEVGRGDEYIYTKKFRLALTISASLKFCLFGSLANILKSCICRKNDVPKSGNDNRKFAERLLSSHYSFGLRRPYLPRVTA